MTATLTTVRTTLATALDGNVSAKIHAGPVTVPIPPCVVIEPDTPWVDAESLTAQSVRLAARVTVRGDLAALPQLETLIEQVLDSLPSGTTWTAVSPPTAYDTGAQGTVIAATVALSTHLTYVRPQPS